MNASRQGWIGQVLFSTMLIVDIRMAVAYLWGGMKCWEEWGDAYPKLTSSWR